MRDCDVTLFIEEGEPARRAFPCAHGQSDSRSECAARHGRKFNPNGEAPAADYFQQVYHPETKCLRKTFELGEIPLARLVGSSAFGSPAMMSAKMRSAFPSSLKKPDLFSDETRFRCARRAKDDHQAAVPQRRANSRSQIRVCRQFFFVPKYRIKRRGNWLATEIWCTDKVRRNFVGFQGSMQPRSPFAARFLVVVMPVRNENYVLAAPFGRSCGWLLTPRNHIQ